ncbi:dihydroorotase [Sphingorhabdus sp.]|jgi:dihydroorotase|uniref:dihydroorotase n=1 Tax=Sphingorhabdus sp. TaxID=1902408 RepID=UPI003BAF2114|nr:amidohydrolase family protein [Sphingomonadales bacterium]MBL0021799.1 amidohydrolase family protein [Sphingomonadales bacterium]
MSGVNILNGRLVLPGQAEPQSGHIHIIGERIAEVGRAEPIAETIDAENLVVAPGIIDLGVFATDKPAFRFGGITRAALMPDQSPVHDDPATIRFAARKGKPDFWVHPLAAATKDLDGKHMAEIALMKQAGALGVATGRRWIDDSGLMLRLMQYCAMLDMPLFVHAEDAGLAGKAVATNSTNATILGLPSAAPIAEELAIQRDLLLAAESGAHLHIRQVTTKRGLDLVRLAKQRGARITCGITPAHLFLSDTALIGFRTFARLSPPLRGETDRLACIAAVADGTIDVIASGHDPRGPEDKRLPFADAAPGMAGAETLLALTLNLVRDGVISMGKLFELLSGNPAKILNLNAGRIAPGHEADLIFIDPDTPWQVDSEKMAALAGNTPFDKLPVQGRVLKTMKGGQIL